MTYEQSISTEVIANSIGKSNAGKPIYVLRNKKTGRYAHYLGYDDLKSKYSKNAVRVVKMPKRYDEKYELELIKNEVNHVNTNNPK